LQSRLDLIENQNLVLQEQKNNIKSILSSLLNKTEPLLAQQRRSIMSFYGQILIVVTGIEGLDKTARLIQGHYANAGKALKIYHGVPDSDVLVEKPAVMILPEALLADPCIAGLHPDVVVVKNISVHSAELHEKYLNLFSGAGPHMNTVINADDRASVDLAGEALLKKGRIFYYSKNSGLKSQIQNIGGVISDGEELEIYGFNLKSKLEFNLIDILAYEDEIALLSSLAAIMTVGFQPEQLALPLMRLK
jgi:hypothetical protein